MARTRAFDDFFSRYEEWFTNHPSVYRSELAAIRHLLSTDGEGLEVGVGAGDFAAPLGVRTGVEPSAAMRALARAKGIDVYDAPAERLPFAAERFVFVLMVTTICFVDDVAASLKEVWRVLVPGGALIIAFVDKDSPLGRIYAARQSDNVFYQEATFYSAAEVCSVLQANGFVVEETIQTVFGEPAEIRSMQPWRKGHGEGGFVVILSRKASTGGNTKHEG